LIAKIQDIPSVEEIIPISAKTEDGIDRLLTEIKKRLPLGPKFYDDDTLTDVHLKDMCSEIIREKLFLALREELPYSTVVEIESFKETATAGKELAEINAAIYVDKRSQKGIVIGQGGSMLKELGTLSRLDMEKLLEKKVMLKLYCRIKEGWRDDPSFLREMGF
jgi:GTP-binding protein Era